MTSDLQEPLLEASPERQLERSQSPVSKDKKRKRTADEDEAPKKPAKKIKKKKPKKPKHAADDGELDTEAGLNNAFSHMDSQLLADYVAGQTLKHESELSSVELEDKYLPVNAIRDTTAWDKPRSLENLPAFLEKFSENTTKLWSASKKNGAPHTIIITAAGLRAAELARIVRKFQAKDSTVAKLFAKHIKLEESIKFLKSTRTGIAVGTPTRLADLVDNGALSLEKLERVVIDASHIDMKKRGILEMKETLVPLTLWLGRKELKDRYGSDINLMFF